MDKGDVMYPINNVIESALRKPTDRLSLLILNEGYDQYIERLAEIDHDFYIVNELYNVPQWVSKTLPANVTRVTRTHELGLTKLDGIIVFNRAGLYEKAYQISKAWHIPLVVIDYASSVSKVPLPFFANVNINNVQEMFNRNGSVTVGLTDDITKSWYSQYQNLSLTIPIPAKKIDRKPQGKILVDSFLPEAYIQSLPINFDQKFTTKPEEADIYLHLWQNITPLMIDCMASEIPVVTFQSQDFAEIINSQACVLIQDLSVVEQSTFLTEMLQFPKLETIKQNALKYTEPNTKNNFEQTWSQVFNHLASNYYIRDKV
jgi:hypothetical protein